MALAGSQLWSSETLAAGIDTLREQGVKVEPSPESREDMQRELEDMLLENNPQSSSFNVFIKIKTHGLQFNLGLVASISLTMLYLDLEIGALFIKLLQVHFGSVSLSLHFQSSVLCVAGRSSSGSAKPMWPKFPSTRRTGF